MADFFDKEETTTEEVVADKIKIGDQEYDPGEAQKLIELGRIGQEAGEKYHTDLTKVWPEYSKSQNELKESRQKLSDFETQLNQYKQKEQAANSTITPDQMEVARQQLEQIMGGKIITDKQFDTLYAQRRAAEGLLEEGKSYEKEIDGTDGRPPFKTEEILTHMRDTGIRNPIKAYKDLYEDQLDSWKEKQLMSNTKKNSFTTATNSSVNKQPSNVRPNKDNISALLAEALHPNGEEE